MITREEITAYFTANADIKYRDFHAGLIPTVGGFLGVRIPVIRELSKRILRDDWKVYLDSIPAETYEELMLRGMVIGGAKLEWSDLEGYLHDFVPKIDNWATCDIFVGALKRTKHFRDQMLELLRHYLTSNREYEVRFAIVMLLSYYIDTENIDFVLKTYASVESEAYYINMALAWGLSICFIKYRTETLTLLESQRLSKWVQNKAIQKIRESYRVTQEDKDMLIGLKK